MARTANHEEYRKRIIQAAIQIVATYGMEGVTSRKIAMNANVCEPYLFRYFVDMADLRKKAFIVVVDEVCAYLSGRSGDKEEYEEAVLYFIRYFYSAEIDEESKQYFVKVAGRVPLKNPDGKSPKTYLQTCQEVLNRVQNAAVAKLKCLG